MYFEIHINSYYDSCCGCVLNFDIYLPIMSNNVFRCDYDVELINLRDDTIYTLFKRIYTR